MSQAHYTERDFVITEKSEGNEYGYCRKCTADMQRFCSDNLLRHYHSHKRYRSFLKNGPVTAEITGVA